MRKHPLHAFAATTLGLLIGATAFGVSGASATPISNQRTTYGGAELVAHRGLVGHQHRSLRYGRNQSGRSVILAERGPTDFLLPKIPSQPATSGAPIDGHILAMLRSCESGNNYSENSGNGFYGAYQFTITSWTHVGGVGLPNLASPALQDEAARRLMAVQGWNAWPMCSAVLGYE